VWYVCGKQRVKIIAYLMSFIKYNKVFNEKFKAQAKQFLLFFPEWLMKRQMSHCCIIYSKM